jgi:glycosyltransferase involved in cell wall biosynthesis
MAPEPWWSRLKRPGELIHVPHETHTGLDVVFPTYWSIPKLTSMHARAMYLSLRPHVARLRREFAFDGIFAAWAYPDAVAASMLARDYDCPFIVKALGSDIAELIRYPALRRQMREHLSRAYRFITVSEALREQVIEIGIDPDRVVAQHNGVNGELFKLRDRAAVRAELGVSRDRRLICFVGRLGAEKAVGVLIEALGHLRRAGREDVDLALVGGGALEGELRAQVDQLGLQDRVRFCGMRPHAEIPLWVSACDVLALPSLREGCPNVILEALASGRPVVASRVGGIPELLNGDNGLMVPPKDAPALATGLQEALHRSWDPEALRASVQFLSWDAVADSYYGFFASAVSSRRGSQPGTLSTHAVNKA